jgi:VIT1/CCC1 family predicted Fe2+/Mn2+ transporter
MENISLDAKSKAILLDFQKNEITEHFIYKKLANKIKDEKNKKILEKIANEEKAHYDFFKFYTNEEVSPNKIKVFFFYWISLIFGLTFGIKLMEKGEESAQISYSLLLSLIPEIKNIIEDEDSHEHSLINLIEEEKLEYVGSIVLGLNDALVELTGALAGFTLALQNTRLIALAGLITGIAASFSMAASGYLSKKAEGDKNALRASAYTGSAYIITVALLILPYLLFHNYFLCLFLTLVLAILIILGFTYYISVAKDLPFRKRFLEMALISLGVSAITFGIGVLIRNVLGINI